MPPTIIVRELLESRKQSTADDPTAELVYRAWVRGDASTVADAEVLTAIEGASPSTYESLYRRGFSSFERQKGDVWEGRVVYGQFVPIIPPATGLVRTTFTTKGGTAHVTNAVDEAGGTGHIHTYSATAVPVIADPHQGALCVADGKPEGTDVIVPVYSWTETWRFETSDVTPAYKGDLFWLTGRMNGGTFRGLAAHEVQFLGMDGGAESEDGYTEITFEFSAAPNLTGLSVGSITGIACDGQDFLWVEYQQTVVSGRQVSRPIYVHVDRIRKVGDFSKLKI